MKWSRVRAGGRWCCVYDVVESDVGVAVRVAGDEGVGAGGDERDRQPQMGWLFPRAESCGSAGYIEGDGDSFREAAYIIWWDYTRKDEIL